MRQTKNVLKRMMRLTLLASVGFAALLSLAQTNAALAATAPPLGAAQTFGVLAALSMSAAGPGTTVIGDLGLSPGLAVSRTGPWFVTGTEYFGPSSLAFTAQGAALSAFNNLAGQASNGPWAASPWSPVPGVWTVASDTTFTGTITLSGGYNDVWVFQVGRDMTFTGSVIMAGNAQACNVFWQIGRDATIALNSTFRGTLIALRDITLVSGATVDGRVISLTGALTTDGNNVSVCSLVVPPLPGSITINKTAVGGDGTFGYTGSPLLGAPFNIITSGGAGSHGTTTGLLAGAYTVTESTMPAGWVQTGLACTDSTALSTFTYSGAQVSINLVPGGTVTCTYTNLAPAAPLGSITINKTAVGGDDTFGYTGSAALGAPFNIITSGGAGSHGTTTGLAAGAYTVTESTVPVGWVRTGLACTDSTAESTFTYSGAQADIALAPGGTVTCTYTNVKQGSITIVKNTVGANGTFGYTGSAALGTPFNITTLGGTGSHGTTGLSLGAYTVTESTVPAGWVQTGLVCTDSTAGSTFTYSGAQANIALVAGGTVTCTFTNILAPAPTAVPTLSEWGMIIFMVLVGLISIYYLRRRRAIA